MDVGDGIRKARRPISPLTDGSGTPMGGCCAANQHPVGLVACDIDPREVRVLGEDLKVLFRDGGGRAGLWWRAAHRGTTLYHGKVETRHPLLLPAGCSTSSNRLEQPMRARWWTDARSAASPELGRGALRIGVRPYGGRPRSRCCRATSAWRRSTTASSSTPTTPAASAAVGRKSSTTINCNISRTWLIPIMLRCCTARTADRNFRDDGTAARRVVFESTPLGVRVRHRRSLPTAARCTAHPSACRPYRVWCPTRVPASMARGSMAGSDRSAGRCRSTTRIAFRIYVAKPGKPGRASAYAARGMGKIGRS